MSGVQILRPGDGNMVGSYEVLPIGEIARDYQSLGMSLVNVMPHSPSKGMHRHDSDEELWLIARGEGVVTYDGGKEARVGPGDVVYCPKGGEHHIKNEGKGILAVFNIHLSIGG